MNNQTQPARTFNVQQASNVLPSRLNAGFTSFAIDNGASFTAGAGPIPVPVFGFGTGTTCFPFPPIAKTCFNFIRRSTSTNHGPSCGRFLGRRTPRAVLEEGREEGVPLAGRGIGVGIAANIDLELELGGTGSVGWGEEVTPIAAFARARMPATRPKPTPTEEEGKRLPLLWCARRVRRSALLMTPSLYALARRLRFGCEDLEDEDLVGGGAGWRYGTRVERNGMGLGASAATGTGWMCGISSGSGVSHRSEDEDVCPPSALAGNREKEPGPSLRGDL